LMAVGDRPSYRVIKAGSRNGTGLGGRAVPGPGNCSSARHPPTHGGGAHCSSLAISESMVLAGGFSVTGFFPISCLGFRFSATARPLGHGRNRRPGPRPVIGGVFSVWHRRIWRFWIFHDAVHPTMIYRGRRLVFAQGSSSSTWVGGVFSSGNGRKATWRQAGSLEFPDTIHYFVPSLVIARWQGAPREEI
jgi:hypothetical protein